nr:hypothetical protein CFP56_45965 [Quercus suber]
MPPRALPPPPPSPVCRPNSLLIPYSRLPRSKANWTLRRGLDRVGPRQRRSQVRRSGARSQGQAHPQTCEVLAYIDVSLSCTIFPCFGKKTEIKKKKKKKKKEWMHQHTKRCHILNISKNATRKKDVFLLVCSRRVAVSAASRHANVALIFSAVPVLD